MKRSTLLLLIPAMALAGCELIVDFDRTKIPTEGADAAPPVPTPDATVTDGAADPDASTDPDAAPDGGEDAGSDATVDDGGDEDGGDDGGDEDGGPDDDAG